MIRDWIAAFRLRTLPLALSCILMGSFLAVGHQQFRWPVFLLAVLTTLFLQILSNLANDYGDSEHGADSADRKGPSRAVQSGKISARAMKDAIIVFSFLSLLSGLSLLYVGVESRKDFWIFLGLGLLCIVAAITYTVGKKPYGYAGLGDISVFIFFGWVGVMGSFYLHSHLLDWRILLPASSCGLFATAVLNINNIRDIASDQKAGKLSLPVRIGHKNAVIYHWFLLLTGMICSVLYVLMTFSSVIEWLFLLALPLFFINALAISKKKKSEELDPFLKQMALSTLAFVLLFGIGQMF